MTIDDILLETEEKMLKSEEHLVHQFAGVRTGKASPSLIENVMVEAYGSHMRLKELATISAPESRMLMVTPFDQGNVKAIEKGIQSANLGLNPARTSWTTAATRTCGSSGSPRRWPRRCGSAIPPAPST